MVYTFVDNLWALKRARGNEIGSEGPGMGKDSCSMGRRTGKEKKEVTS